MDLKKNSCYLEKHCVGKDSEAMSELKKEVCDLLAISTMGERFRPGHTCAIHYFS